MAAACSTMQLSQKRTWAAAASRDFGRCVSDSAIVTSSSGVSKRLVSCAMLRSQGLRMAQHLPSERSQLQLEAASMALPCASPELKSTHEHAVMARLTAPLFEPSFFSLEKELRSLKASQATRSSSELLTWAEATQKPDFSQNARCAGAQRAEAHRRHLPGGRLELGRCFSFAAEFPALPHSVHRFNAKFEAWCIILPDANCNEWLHCLRC